MVEDSQNQPGVDAPGFEERKGGRTFAILDGVAVIEPRCRPGTLQKTSGLYDDEPSAPLVRYRLQQGLAHFQGRSVT